VDRLLSACLFRLSEIACPLALRRQRPRRRWNCPRARPKRKTKEAGGRVHLPKDPKGIPGQRTWKNGSRGLGDAPHLNKLSWTRLCRNAVFLLRLCPTLPIRLLKRNATERTKEEYQNKGFEERRISLLALDVTFCSRNLV
jgi:hypothetical protein